MVSLKEFGVRGWTAWIVFAAIVVANPALCDSPGAQYSLDKYGLEGLSFNGQSYLAKGQGVGSYIVNGALFLDSAGNQKAYGWYSSSLDKDAFRITSDNSSSGSNPDYYQQVYRKGLADSVTFKQVWSSIDSRTLQVDTYITNNDSADTLAQINWENGLPLQIPEPANQYNNNIPIELGPQQFNGGYPAAFLSGTWGSLAIWMGNYSGTQNVEIFYRSADQTQFNVGVSSSSKNQIGTVYETTIPPLATRKFTIYLRFGSVTDTATSLAPEAFNLMGQAYPYQVNWTDRRPIARWFIANSPDMSATNPRGYFWDRTMDVSNQRNFTNRLVGATLAVINRLNAMNPKPQGIIVWDLEGQEFQQFFTYVGNPPKLHDMAPEMDAAADRMFNMLTAAGYKVGVTIRPSDFMTGPILPSTCNTSTDTNPTSGVVLEDVFVSTTAAHPYRGYACTGPNTWTQPGANLPYYQTIHNDDAQTLSILESKISYAYNRWGAKLFYIDSTVYSRGAALNFNIFRQLQRDFPDIIVFPEITSPGYYGTAAPYRQANTGSYGTPSSVKDIYSQAFSIVQALDGVDYANPSTFNTMVQSVRNGDILFVDGWWDNPQNKYVLKVYRTAIGGSSSSSTSTPRNPGISQAPRRHHYE